MNRPATPFPDIAPHALAQHLAGLPDSDVARLYNAMMEKLA